MPTLLSQLQSEAESLLRSGQRHAAIEAYRRLLSTHPAHAEAWYNLAYLLKQEGHYQQSLDAYGHALRSGIEKPEEIHLNRAVIYSDHLRLDEHARHDLEAALQLAPNYRPARLNLGNLHEERGERAAAISCYAQILADAGDGSHLDPHQLEALSRLSQLTPPGSTDDPLLGQLRRATGKPGPLDAPSRANLFFALGRACDRLGEYAPAFDAFASGKRIAHDGYPAYDRSQARRTHDALIRTSAPAQDRPDDADSPAPIFICGMFRSGSTLLEQVLATHPRIHAGGELDLLPRLLRGITSELIQSGRPAMPGDLSALARRYIEQRDVLFPQASGLRYITDKRPDNLHRVGIIKQMFPRARIIHTRRHPMDTGLSIFMQHLNPRSFAYAASLADIGHHHGEQDRLMSHWMSLYPSDIHSFDYDAFVMNPEPELARVLDFLELEWNADWMRFHLQSNTVKTASFWQVRQPLNAESLGRWRHYEMFLAPLREALEQASVDVAR